MDGVVVVSSKGYEGNECCESHPGSRQLVVRLDEPDGTPLLTLQQLMDDAGWDPTKCAGPEPASKKLCAQTGGLFAVLTLPRSDAKQDESLVYVKIERSPY
jgi:hypothetical protein